MRIIGACFSVEALAGGDDLKPFRALWLYNAAVAAEHARKRHPQTLGVTPVLPLPSREAIGLTSNVGSLAGLGDLCSSSPDTRRMTSIGVEEIGNLLTEWEVVGHRFAKGLPRRAWRHRFR